MIHRFTAKEIHFLKTGADPQEITPPDTYLSDLIHSPTVEFTAFEQRLKQTDIPGDRFIAAVIQVDKEAPEKIREAAPPIFEACFHSLLDKKTGKTSDKQADKKRGIWEGLDPTTFVLVLWDYKTQADGIRLLTLLKEKISGRLEAGLIMGVAPFPFHGYAQKEVLHNALKAIDHAAFFGPGQMISFDGISLNISGDRLFQLKKVEGAIHEYEQGLDIAPKNINLINSLGVAYGITDQLDKALECFEQASAINPEEVMVIYNIGLIHRIKEKTDKALLYLKKAHAITPEIFEIELLLGHLLFKENQYQRALPHLDAAIRLNPESGTAFRIKGQIVLDNGDPAEAGPLFNSAVKLNPNDAAALSGYAKAMALQKKNLAIALSFAQKALAIDPENREFKQRLGEIRDIHDQVQEMNRHNTIKSA